MNAGMKMMLVNESRKDGDQRGGNYPESDYRGNDSRYDGRDGRRQRTENSYERRNMTEDNDTEMRQRRRRYDNGRFRPTRGGADYLNDPEDDDDDDDAEARYPYMPERIPPMGQIGFTAGGGHGKVTEMHRGGSRMMEGGKLDKADAEGWVRSMKNEDGTTGPHWTMEQAKQVMAQKGVTGEPVEFWAALNATYSDLVALAKRHGVNSIDFYVDFVKTFWLGDKDAGEGKLMKYYEYVVK